MNYQKSFFFIPLVFAIFFNSCNKEPFSVPTDREILGDIVKPQISDEYIYPIKPGMPEWAKLTSHMEMEKVVQIPDSVLKKISTWGLVESCFKYPLYADFAAFNNQVKYINDLTVSFSGFKELFSRDDAPKILLYYYRHWDVKLYPSFLERNFIELTIGSDSFLSKLNENQLLYLISTALEMKEQETSTYTGSLPPYSFFVMANSLIHYPYKPFQDYCASIKNPIPNGNFFWGINSSCEKIEEYSRSLLDL